jgi:exosortase
MLPDDPSDSCEARARTTIVRTISYGILSAGFAWSFWSTLVMLFHCWGSDPRYSHGYFIPIFAAVLLWLRRDRLDRASARGSAWGWLVLMAAGVVRLVGARLSVESLDGLAIPVALAGLVLLLGGRAALTWAGPSVAFLVFMVPLPYRVDTALAGSLQRIATLGGTYVLQTLGVDAFAEGNVIVLARSTLRVVDACSGLGILVSFVALATAGALLVRRPAADKVAMVLSSVPIAVVVNVLRIAAMGVLQALRGGRLVDPWIHDGAGLVMMLVAATLLWVELAIFARLFVARPAPVPLPIQPGIAPRPFPKPVQSAT